MAETYVPLLNAIAELYEEGIKAKLTVGITPILAEQLNDEHLQNGFVEITRLINGGKFIQPAAAALVGLIPNCAISIGLTMMLIKGTISFGAVISGLLANSGLGLLVLLKNNDFKDSGQLEDYCLN